MALEDGQFLMGENKMKIVANSQVFQPEVFKSALHKKKTGQASTE